MRRRQREARRRGLDGCVLTLLADTDLLVAGLDEMLRGADMGIVERNQFLGKVRVPFDRVEPLAKGLVKGLLVTEAVTNAWDAIWDNLADGKLTLNLKGIPRLGSPPPSTQRLPRLPAPIG